MDVMIFVLDKRQTILIKIKLISKIKTDYFCSVDKTVRHET